MKITTTGTTEEIYTIPVVVHVVHNDVTNTPGRFNSPDISDAQIHSQITVLQEDFRRKNSDTINTSSIFESVASDTKIEFCLASRDPNGNNTSGITRHFTNIESWDIQNADEYTELRTHGYWPPTQYLNIWVASLSYNLLGIATFPIGSDQPNVPLPSTEERDGIVVDHTAFGNKTGTANGHTFDQGRSAVHEIGHWLGLLHTFQGSCTGNGDHCSDTPFQNSSSSDCPVNQSSCSTRDMSENFMDYTDDACMNMFSLDQKNRMRAVIESAPMRNALLLSPGCCGGGTTIQIPFTNDFEENDINEVNWSIENSSVNLEWDIISHGMLSSYSLNTNTNGSNDDTTSFISNIINFNGSDIPALTFDLSYNYEDQRTSNDRFILSYEESCGNEWRTIKEFTIEEITTSLNQGTTFSPTNDNWLQHYLQLPELSSLFAVKLRFQVISGNNGSFFLDNINVFNESSEPLFELYPNPTNADFNIKFSHQLIRSANIIMYDVLGTVINTYTIPESYSDTFKISTNNVPSGIYILVLQSTEYTQTEKLVITK